MSASISAKDCHPTIQSGFHVEGVPGGSVLYNRRHRRAMRKCRKVATRRIVAAPRMGAAPRRPATSHVPGRSRTRGAETGPPRAGLPPQPTFAPISSALAFGPPTDISMGWDGTVWSIDASGAPHLYDPLADQWNPFGEGVDAATAVGNTLYLFRGSQYVTVDLATNQVSSGPTDMATTWPSLPDSFKLGLTGAATVGGKLIAFKGGWYVSADGSSARAKLTDLRNWPQTATWADGVLDAVFYTGKATGAVYLFRNGEYIVADFQNQTITQGPQPAGNVLPPTLATSGTDAASFIPTSGYTVYFHGTSVVSVPPSGGAGATYYIATLFQQWPASWNPLLAHAPSGRMGNLWVATAAQGIVQHDGEQWNVMPGSGNTAAAGQDGTVMVTSQSGLYKWNGAGYDALGNPGSLAQVAIGDTNHVWVRDEAGTVQRYSATHGFTPVSLGAGVPNPTYIAANADGTLWHCNSDSPNAYRFISEAAAPSGTLQVKQGIVTGVQKVASTGFGTAHCLVRQSDGSTQVYRYDSPYVFKTPSNYPVWDTSLSTFAQGLGNLYFVQFVSETIGPSGPTGLSVRFVAMDLHTGKEVASYTPPGTSSQYTSMVFDPVNELVYVASAPFFNNSDGGTPGTLYALDARTLAVEWTSSAYKGIDATPALNGTTLCFGDRSAQLYCIDTQAALAAAAQGKPIPNKWVFQIDINGPVHRVSTPLINGNQVVAMMWDMEYDPSEGLVLYTTVSVDVNSGTGNPFGLGLPVGTVPVSQVNYFLVLPPPLMKPLLFPGCSTPSLAIIVRAVNSLIAWNLESDQSSQLVFNLPSGTIASGVAYDDGTRLGSGVSPTGVPQSRTRLWFGDDQGNLWALDQQFHAVDGTPIHVLPHTQIFTMPVLYKDPQGGLTVLFGVYDPSHTLPPSLYGYDPDSGNLAGVPTGVTTITTLSPNVINGVVYAGGTGIAAANDPVQVFGIRVDALPQALRDFIVESQMMQDPDQNAPGGDRTYNPDNADPIPPSRARYQTHLSVVDDQKNPQPNEVVKIWADAPTTILVQGRSDPFTIGPGDTQYASVKTGSDGALVITTGYSLPDGSDKPDMYAPALRVWASFMDPFERIVVTPDHEFHERISTAHANTDDDDPDKVNLVTTRSYAGTNNSPAPTPLFTTGEQQAGQPDNCAKAIGQMKSGLGFGGGGSTNATGALFTKRMLHTGGRKQAHRALRRSNGPVTVAGTDDTPAKYLAYKDLTATGYFPANIPATRPTTVQQPTGLLFIKPQGQPTTSATFTATDHATAQAAIDTLPPPTPNPPWKTPAGSERTADGTVLFHRVGNIFTDFWNWLKKEFEALAIEITHILVSIADEVMVGIQFVVKGVTKVFKAIVKVIDDIASAIGSFFKMLAKLIEDVIAALSVLFHFGEIIDTHKWIRDQINANLQQAVSAMQTQVKPPVDQFFQQGEQAITTLFNNIRQQLGINADTQINSVNSGQSTPHTAFTAGPGAVGPTSGGSGSSHAVQCTHTTQKMKNGLPSAAQPGDSILNLPKDVPAIANDDDTLSTFVTNFVTSLQTNPTISSALTNLKSAINNIGQSQSAGDFFKSALNLLLTVIEDLILGMVAVTQALVDGLIGAIQALINTVVGLLNTPVNIPFISWLYQLIFGEPLTILNAVSLVAAIPVTIIYRVVEGRYPSEDGITGAAMTSASVTRAGRTAVSVDVIKKMQGLIGGVIALGLGIVRGVVDEAGPNPPRIGTIFVLTFGVAYVSTYFPLMIPGAAPMPTQWAEWGLGAALALLGTFGVISLKNAEPATQAIFKGILTFLRVGLGVARFIVFIVAFATSGNRNAVTDVQFARNLFLELPPMFNWLKLLAEPANIVLTVIDVVTGVVVCALDITAAFIDTETAPRMQRPIMA